MCRKLISSFFSCRSHFFDSCFVKTDIVILGYDVGSSAVGSARPYSWASWLAESGKRIVIISGPFHNSSALIRSNLRIVSLYSPLYYIGKFLQNFVSELSVYSKSYFSLNFNLEKFIGLQFRLASSWKSATYKRKSFSGLFTYRMPNLYDLWYPFALFELLKIRPRTVIASHSPYITFLVGYTYKCIFPSSTLIIDYRDMWTLSRDYSGLPFFRYLERALESIILDAADKVIVVSNGQASHLSSAFPTVSTNVIRNTSSLETFSELCQEPYSSSKSRPGKFKLLYTGTLYPSFQDPSPIFEEISKLRLSSVICPNSFCLEVVSPQIDIFSSFVDKFDLWDYVDLLPFMPRNQCFLKMQEASCFLLLEDQLTESHGVVTSKMYDYLYVGKPILVHGISKTSELYRYVCRHGFALGLKELPALIDEFTAEKFPHVESFSQVASSRSSLLPLISDSQK